MRVFVAVFIGAIASATAVCWMIAKELGWRQLQPAFMLNNRRHKERVNLDA